MRVRTTLWNLGGQSLGGLFGPTGRAAEGGTPRPVGLESRALELKRTILETEGLAVFPLPSFDLLGVCYFFPFLFLHFGMEMRNLAFAITL